MNKDELTIKLAMLETNEKVKREELEAAASQTRVARIELADAGKPVISESIVCDLVEQLESVFADTICNIDTSDLSPEFSLNYNEISLDEIDLSNVGIDTDELHTVFSQFFAIQEDEELKQDDNS
jgi:hypothetical protein